MRVYLAFLSSTTAIYLPDEAFWDSLLARLHTIDSLLFDAPVEEGLAYLGKWLEHRSLDLAHFYQQPSLNTLMGFSFAFNLANGFGPQPSLLLVHIPHRPPTMLAYFHHLDRSILPALDALVGDLPVSIIPSGEPEATTLTAYLRLTDRRLGFPQRDSLNLDQELANWHCHRWPVSKVTESS